MLIVEWFRWGLGGFPFAAVVLAFVAAMGKIPQHWLQEYAPNSFFEILQDNAMVWLVSYSFALAVYLLLFSQKYDRRSTSPMFMVEEAVRSMGGILVLSIMQTFVQQYRDQKGYVDNEGFSLLHLPISAFWGDFHFYWTHRLLHCSWLYTAIHKVHHQSYLVNPLSGLSMHPAEHAVYFSSVLLGLLPVHHRTFRGLCLSLIVFPIPGHIGIWPFETHHWLHHTKFNYNFGSSPLWDWAFGTSFSSARKQASKGPNNAAVEASRQAQLVGTKLD